MKKITIAIDGFSSCGKSTMAKALAKSIGYIYIDSGAMYRAVTFYCLENNLFNEKEVLIDKLRAQMNAIHISFALNKEGKPETYLNGENVEQQIRSMHVSAHVSQVSTIDFVRTTMVAAQQQMGAAKGIVMDGRDIGTTVFPEAELKIFVTASAEIRAQRRYDELQQKGEEVDFQKILENVKERDFIDQNRVISPLRKAEDAFLLDNSLLTIPEQQEWLLQKYQETIHH